MGKRMLGIVGVVVAVGLAVSGCTGDREDPAPGPSSASGGQRPSVPAMTTPPTTPTPTATTPPIAEPAERTVQAGTVADGTTASASGSGEENVAFTSRGDIAVVVELDCSACTGTATVTAPGRMSPFGRATAPLRASFLTGVLESDGPDQSVIVEATGKWSVTLRSWNDLPHVTGAQSGKGPAVFFLVDDVSHVSVDFRPSGPDDSFSGRVFTTSGRPQLFGDSGTFVREYEVDLPGVMAIQTNGSWTVTPTP